MIGNVFMVTEATRMILYGAVNDVFYYMYPSVPARRMPTSSTDQRGAAESVDAAWPFNGEELADGAAVAGRRCTDLGMVPSTSVRYMSRQPAA